MKAELETRRRIETWLDDEIEVRASEDLLDAARRRIAATRQRPRWLTSLRRDRQAFATLRLVGAGAAIAVAIVVGAGAVGFPFGAGVGGGVTESPTLPSYTTQDFEPRITVTIPAAWYVKTDSAVKGFGLESVDPETATQIDVCLRPFASEPDRNVPASGVGQSGDALMRHLMGRFDYRILAGPVNMDIDGLQGSYLDIEGFSGTQERMVLASGDSGSFCPQNLYGTEQLRLGFLDLPDGSTISIGVHSFSGPDKIASGWQLVTSFRIDRTSLAPTP